MADHVDTRDGIQATFAESTRLVPFADDLVRAGDHRLAAG
jgi:hypothetical protein